jgi:hypothetical protein
LKPSLLNSGQQYTSSLLFKFMLRVDFRFSLELHGIDSIIMLTLMGTAVIKQLQQVGQYASSCRFEFQVDNLTMPC